MVSDPTMMLTDPESEPLIRSLQLRAEATTGEARADFFHQAALAAEMGKGGADKAIDFYRQALGADPNHQASLHALMRLLDAPDGGEKADERADQLMGIGGGVHDVELLCARAERRLQGSQLGPAGEALTQAVRRDPAHRRSLLLSQEMAALEESLGDMSKGVRQAAQSLAQITGDERFREALQWVAGRIGAEQEEPDEEAIEAVKEIAERSSWRLGAGWLLERSMRQARDHKGLLEAQQAAVKASLDPCVKLSAAVEAAAVAAWHHDQGPQGAEVIKEVLDGVTTGLGRVEIGVAQEFAVNFFEGYKPEDELELLRELGRKLESPARQAVVFTRIAQRITEKDIEPGGIESEKALRYVDAAIEAVSDYRPAVQLLSEMHAEGAFPQKGRDLLRRQAEQSGRPEPLLEAARLTLEQLERPEEAHVLLRQAVAQSDEADLLGPTSVLDSLEGLKVAEPDERLKLMREALGRCQTLYGRRALLRELSRQALLVDKPQEAIESLTKLVDADPEDAFYTERLADMLARGGSWTDVGELRRRELANLEERDPEQALEVMYVLGRLCAVALGDSEAALGWYRAILDRSPGDMSALAAAGRIMIQERRWEELAALHQRELEHVVESSNRARLSFRLGTLYERVLQDKAQARFYYEQVRSINPNHLPSLFGLVRVAAASEDWPLWVELVDEWSKRERDDVLAGTLACELAQVQEMQLGRPKEALESFRRALERLPKLELARLGILRCLYRVGRNDEAAQMILERLPEDASREERQEMYSWWMLLREDEAQAAVDLVAAYGDHVPAQLASLRQALRQGRLADAARHAGQLGRILPGGSLRVGLQRLAQVLARLVDESVLTMHEDMPTQEKQSVDEMTLLQLEASLRDAADMGALESLMKGRARAAELPMVRAAYFSASARALQGQGQHDAALLRYKDALESQRDFVPAAKTLKLVYELINDREGLAVASELEGAIARDPQVALGNFLVAGDLRRRHLGDMEGAIQDLETALRIDPANEAAFESLREIYSVRSDGQALYRLLARRAEAIKETEERKRLLLIMAQMAFGRLKDRELAIRCHQQVLEIDPKHIQSLRILAEIFQSDERWEDAIHSLRRVLTATKDKHLLSMTCRTIAELYDAKLSDPRRAIEAYDAMLMHDPDHVPSLRRLGQLLQGEGSWEDAARAYGQVLQRERSRSKLIDDLKALAVICFEGLQDPQRAEQCLSQALRLNNQDIEIHRLLVEHYVRQKQAAQLEAHLRQAARQFGAAFLEDITKKESYQGFFQILRWLQDDDRAFVAAAVGKVLRLNQADQRDLYMRTMEASIIRLPSQPIPIDMTDVTLPKELSMSLLSLMRIGEAIMRKLFAPNLRELGVSRRTRLSERDSRPGARALLSWPKLFSLQDVVVHVVPDAPDEPAAYMHDQPLLVVSPRGLDLAGQGQAEFLGRCGQVLAPLSMGVGAMAGLDDGLFVAAIAALVRPQVPGYLKDELLANHPDLPPDKVARALARLPEQKMVAHALDVSGKLDANGLLAQRELFRTAFERLAMIPVFDPAPFLAQIRQERGDEALAAFLPYVLSERFANLRRAVRMSL